MKSEVFGECGKHKGYGMIDCPICASEKMKEFMHDSPPRISDAFKDIVIIGTGDKFTKRKSPIKIKDIPFVKKLVVDNRELERLLKLALQHIGSKTVKNQLYKEYKKFKDNEEIEYRQEHE